MIFPKSSIFATNKVSWVMKILHPSLNAFLRFEKVGIHETAIPLNFVSGSPKST